MRCCTRRTKKPPIRTASFGRIMARDLFGISPTHRMAFTTQGTAALCARLPNPFGLLLMLVHSTVELVGKSIRTSNLQVWYSSVTESALVMSRMYGTFPKKQITLKAAVFSCLFHHISWMYPIPVLRRPSLQPGLPRSIDIFGHIVVFNTCRDIGGS